MNRKIRQNLVVLSFPLCQLCFAASGRKQANNLKSIAILRTSLITLRFGPTRDDHLTKVARNWSVVYVHMSGLFLKRLLTDRVRERWQRTGGVGN